MTPIFPGTALRRAPVVTPIGSTRFEQARSRLAELAGREREDVTNADVIEFLRRGEAATIAYLAPQP